MSAQDDRVRLPVKLFMKDGRELEGDILANMGGTLDRTMNNETRFIAFASEDGERMIAKDAVLELEKRQVSKKGDLPGLNPSGPAERPHRVLGIKADASDEEITAAFMAKVETYRPDQFTDVSLPPEVSDYINTTYRRIYEAHQTLMAGKTAALGHQVAAE